MQGVRHRHSGVNRGGVASHHNNRFMYVKVAKKFKWQGESEGILFENENDGN